MTQTTGPAASEEDVWYTAVNEVEYPDEGVTVTALPLHVTVGGVTR